MGSLALLIIMVLLGARAFGELFVEIIKTIIAAIRAGNPSLMAQLLLPILAGVVAALIVTNTWDRLLPTEGVSYVPIPLIERLANWLTDTLNTLLSSQ